MHCPSRFLYKYKKKNIFLYTYRKIYEMKSNLKLKFQFRSLAQSKIPKNNTLLPSWKKESKINSNVIREILTLGKTKNVRFLQTGYRQAVASHPKIKSKISCGTSPNAVIRRRRWSNQTQVSARILAII